MTNDEIIALAKTKGWEFVAEHKESFVLIFQKDTAVLNVWPTKMTVATTVDHPKHRKQLFRKWVTRKELIAILENPRVHTRKGYYTKSDRR